MKNLKGLIGDQPTTIQLVEQCLNQLYYRLPQQKYRGNLKYCDEGLLLIL
jgi:hypothetical protein